MKLVRSTLTVFLLLLSALCTGPLSAQAQDEGTFRFSVCNKSPNTASIAIAHLSAPGQEEFVVKGWFNVEAGKCNPPLYIGSFPQGTFYYFGFAVGRNGKLAGQWKGAGDAVELCVTQEAFDHPVPDESKCEANEVLVEFGAEEMTEDTIVTLK